MPGQVLKTARIDTVTFLVSLAALTLVACSNEPEAPTPTVEEHTPAPATADAESSPPSPTADPAQIERSTASQNATVGRAARLKVGEVAFYESDGLEVRFLAVVEDSRCPTSAQCIQAGRARVSIQVRANAGNHAILTIEVSGSDDRRTRVVGAHTLTVLELEPYPEIGAGDPDYVSTVLVGLSLVE